MKIPESLITSLPDNMPTFKKNAILKGILAWCFNSDKISLKGAVFVSSIYSIRLTKLHSFFSLNVDGNKIPKAIFLEKDYELPKKARLIANWDKEIKKVIFMSGWCNERLSKREIKRVLSCFISFLRTKEGLKQTQSIMDWGHLITADDGEALVKIKTRYRDLYYDPFVLKRQNRLHIKEEKSFWCSGCEQMLPCSEEREMGQALCNYCAQKFDIPTNCMGLDCGIYGCSHAGKDWTLHE